MPSIVHMHVPLIRVYKSVCGKLGTDEEPCVHRWEIVTCVECLKLKKED